MDATDEFQEADILWPDTTGDELVVPPFAAADDMAVEEPCGAASSSVSDVAPAFGRRRLEEVVFLTGASPDADADEEEWQEADVLWPDTVGIVPRGSGGGLLLPFPSRHASPAAASCDGWRPPAASTPIDIPTNNVGARRRFSNSGRRR